MKILKLIFLSVLLANSVAGVAPQNVRSLPQYIQEKLDTFAPLRQKVSEDFKALKNAYDAFTQPIEKYKATLQKAGIDIDRRGISIGREALHFKFIVDIVTMLLKTNVGVLSDTPLRAFPPSSENYIKKVVDSSHQGYIFYEGERNSVQFQLISLLRTRISELIGDVVRLLPEEGSALSRSIEEFFEKLDILKASLVNLNEAYMNLEREEKSNIQHYVDSLP